MCGLLKYRFTVTLEVQGEAQAHFWLSTWLSAQPQGRSLHHLGLVRRYNEQAGGHSICVGTDSDDLIPLT